MRLKRRNFLLLGGLASFSLVGLWGFLTGQKLGTARSAQPSLPGSPDLAPPDLAPPDLVSPDPAIAPTPSTSVAQAKPLLRFVAIADTGAGDRNQYAVADAMTRYHRQNPYSLVVLAGDNIYTNGEMWKIRAVFEQPYQALLQQGVQFRACLGNHDIRTENGDPQVRYPGFHMQGRYYTFREKSVQFFVLDTNGNADWKQQLDWLNQELSRSDAAWKIVYGHHPIYSSGRYGTNPAFVKMLTPLFKQYNVQLYINGHEHSYERTRPIDGTTYLITGIGGAALRRVGQSAWTAHSVSRFGFSALEVYGDRLEIWALGTNNQVFDHGIIPLKILPAKVG